MSALHPVGALPGVLDYVRFVRTSALPGLPVPWPRSQDLDSADCAKPSKEDLVIAVSHAWPYQAHPDPNGEKVAQIQKLVQEAEAVFRPPGASLLFFDFCSAPQRAFRAGQAQRSPEQDEQFATALRAFPQIYLMADATIHLDPDLSQVPGDSEEFWVPQSDLPQLALQQVGEEVQVVGWNASGRPLYDAAPFDVVVAVGGVLVRTVEDVRQCGKATSPAPAWWCCTAQRPAGVRMRRAPFGRRNDLPAGVRGWIYLERFVSMVKAAMVPEAQVPSVAFSNSPAILDQIFAGGRKLRAAAQEGQKKLAQVLEEFFVELEGKRFSATSMDKVQNTGGVGGLGGTVYSASEADVVKALMRELVDHLAQHWAAEARAQEHRQLIMAVSRGDTASLRAILQAGVALDVPDCHGWTPLHVAAKMRNVENVKLLIEWRADLTTRNSFGNCPALVMAFLSEDSTLTLLDLLAPSRRELSLRNVAGVSPLTRFAVWVMSELHFKPFPAAQARLQEFRARYPDLLAELTATSLAGRAPAPGLPKSRVEMCAVGGREVPVHVWEPAGRPEVNIVWFALAGTGPWAVQEAAIAKVASKVCLQFKAKIFVLTYDAAASFPVSMTMDQFYDFWKRAVEALPLGQDKFVLVDDSMGFCTDLLWLFQERLRAVLVLSFSCFWQEDYLQTSYGPKHRAMMKGMGSVLTKEKREQLSAILGAFACLLDGKAIEEGVKVYAGALEAAPDCYWRYLGLVSSWIPDEDRSRRFRALGPLAPSCGFPITLAGGPFASSAFTLEPMQRVVPLLARCRVVYIPYSKTLWCMEGDAQVPLRAISACTRIRNPSETSRHHRVS